MARFTSVMVLFVVLAGGLSAQIAPPADATVETRFTWLENNIGADSFGAVLSSTVEAAETVAHLDAVRDQFLPRVSKPNEAAEIASVLAAVYRAARRLPAAEEMYRVSYELSGRSNLDALFERALILFELGATQQADQLARTVLASTSDYSQKRRAYTLVARAAYAGGDLAGARSMLTTLASLANDEEAGRETVEVESLVLLYQVQMSQDDAVAASATRNLITSLFPESLAGSLLGSRPRSLVSAGLPGTISLASPGEPPAREEPRFTAVQVGSFGDSENAGNLVVDLVALGLDARSEAVSREGDTLHQVFVGVPGGSTEEAAEVFRILQDNGFDGFLVY